MSKKPKILIVEDNPDNLETFSTFLEFYDYPVRQSTDGEQAILAVQEEKPDVIFLDLSLPKVDGWEVARQIRANPDNQDIIIIAFSAMALPKEMERALNAGCDSFISKPLPPDILVAEMQKLLEQRQ